MYIKAIILALSLFLGFLKEAFPLRLVSLSPSATEAVKLLGAEDKLCGATYHCRVSKNVARVGTILCPNIEKILKLEPDFVLISPLCRRRHAEKMKELGLHLFLYRRGGDFEEVCKAFLELATLIKKEKEAERVIERARKILHSSKRVKGCKIFWQVGRRPLVTVSEGSYADGLIKKAGAVNIFSSSFSYPRCSLEEVIKREPDAILIVTMGMGQEEKRWWSKYPIKAVKEGRIYTIPAKLFCIYTPLHFAKAVRKLCSLLNSR
jgi:iron complex transport system substrate-binding protein